MIRKNTNQKMIQKGSKITKTMIKNMTEVLALTLVMTAALTGCSGKETVNSADPTPAQPAQESTLADTGAPSGSQQETDSAVGTDKDNESTTPVTFTDGLGNQVSILPTDHAAVISGSYAQAWMLAGGQLDAVTEDVYSERDVEIPETTVDLGMLKSPNVEALVGSGATFAILSANIEEHLGLRDTLEKSGITTAYFSVETFEDYLDMMKICTDITGRADLYEKNGAAIKAKVDEQIARADGSKPTVLFLRAFSTGVRAKGSDNMTGKMLKDLDCINIADDDKSLLDDLSMESIIAQDPDYIFVTTMGSSEEAAIKSVEDMLQSNPAWNELSAVKNDRYHVLPKALFHNKPNDRWGESYEILADILYGEHKSESN